MKERLFALLLAAVMVLSLGMAAIPEGTDDGTGAQMTAQETIPEVEKGSGETDKAAGGTGTGAAKAPGETEQAPGDTAKTITVRIVNEAGAALRLTDPMGTEYADGSQVRPDEKGNYSLLAAALDEGFVFADSEEYTYDPAAGKLLLTDRNGDGVVTVTVAAQTVPQPEENEQAGGDELAEENEQAGGGELTEENEQADKDELAEGDELTDGAEKDEAGPEDEAVPVPLNEGDALPAPIAASITVTYEDNDHGILTEDLPTTIPAGGAIELTVSDEYTVTVTNGEAMWEGENDDGIVYGIYPDDGVATMTITVRKLQRDAKLKVKDHPEALANDQAGEGAYYLQDGDTLGAGIALVKVKSGYKITKAEGGRVEYFHTGWDGEAGKDEIFTYYRLEAWDATLTITVEEDDPSYWVTVKLVNPYPDQVTLSTFTAESDSETDYLPVVPWLDDYFDGRIALSAKTKAILDNYTVTITDSEEMEEGDFGSGEVEPEKWFDFTLKDKVTNITVTVVRLVEVKAPGTPMENNPGVPDKAAAEKKLLAEATAVAAAVRAGETPAGVTDTAGKLREAVEADKIITTELAVTKISTSADEEKFKAAAGKDTIAQYVKIEILLKTDTETVGHITQTSAPMDFAVVLSSADLTKGKIFYVIRSHDGATDILPATLDGNTLTFSSDKFSDFAVVATNDIAHATVDGIADQTWTGKAITPKPVVRANGKALTEGTDYTLSYKDNVNVGTATVIITGKAPYTGTKTVTFRIVKPAAGGTGAKTAPQTGDETPIALYAALLVLSATALALTVTRRKKTSR